MTNTSLEQKKKNRGDKIIDGSIMYLNGTYKCKVVWSNGRGDFIYIPYEGVPDKKLKKRYNSNTSVYFLSRERTPEPHNDGKLAKTK